MVFEDGSEPTLAALRLFESQKEQLNCPDLKILSLPEFLKKTEPERLTYRQKEILVEQAILLIDQFYAHLPYKRARYATDPVRRFRVIHAQLHHFPSDLAFHDQMIQAFMRLRDAHTFYGLPAPYRGAFAFLPFRMDYYGEPGHRRFLVTNDLEGFEHERFGAGAEITFWQGMPVERAIERQADQEPGCNPSSRFVRGMKRMAKRNLAFSLPPDEHSVVIQYIPRGGGAEQFSIALPWSVATACLPETKRAGAKSSVNESMADLEQLSKLLWRRKQLVMERNISRHYASANTSGANTIGQASQVEGEAGGMNPDLSRVSKFPHAFEFQYTGAAQLPGFVDPACLHDPEHPDKKFGYVRIKTFELDPSDPNSDSFVDEFQRILTLIQQEAPHGLILDVRSNPGGAIDAAERILQLMTPCTIETAKFHFINSPATQQIAFALKHAEAAGSMDADLREWHPWVTDLLASVTSADFVTSGRPLTSPEAANEKEQCYQGSVTLLIDASSYSATDIFAAGFQDHGVGQVIGVNENTGGGGANRWLHEEMREKLAKLAPQVPLEKLPSQAKMGIAIRRSSRVGPMAGTFLEDEGVKRDIAYAISRDDLLHGDRDLFRFACRHLGAQPTRSLKILQAELLDQDGIGLIVETHNVYRIDCFLDGLQQCSFATVDGVNVFFAPTGGLVYLPPSQLRVDGYAKIQSQAGIDQLRLVAKVTCGIDASTDPAGPAVVNAVSG